MNLYKVFFSGRHTRKWLVAATSKKEAIDLVWQNTDITYQITDFDAEEIKIGSFQKPTIIN